MIANDKSPNCSQKLMVYILSLTCSLCNLSPNEWPGQWGRQCTVWSAPTGRGSGNGVGAGGFYITAVAMFDGP